jgi:hypothetical protein
VLKETQKKIIENLKIVFTILFKVVEDFVNILSKTKILK